MNKIKVITAYEGECCYQQLTLANMREYCGRWGYEFIAQINNPDWKPLVHPYNFQWRKVQILIEEMHDCEWLLWLDLDCFFLNMTIPLDGVFTDPTADLVIPGGGFGPCPECGKPVHNVGLFSFRNCDWSRETLIGWWDQELERLKLQPKPEYTHCVGETLWLSCQVVENPVQAPHIKVLPLEIAGWATITRRPEQFITHQYAALPALKQDRFKQLEQWVIR